MWGSRVQGPRSRVAPAAIRPLTTVAAPTSVRRADKPEDGRSALGSGWPTRATAARTRIPLPHGAEPPKGVRKPAKSVRSGRIELPQYYYHQNLNLARLPVPPRPRQEEEHR